MLQTTTGLENLTLWLWDNKDEGLHITMTTNYNLPTEKRWFFSYSGAQTKNTLTAYNRSQPENLKDWFYSEKSSLQKLLKHCQESGFDCYVSKQSRNTGTKGRQVAQGYCALMMPKTDNQIMFRLKMKDLIFTGEFDPNSISKAQKSKGCLGVFKWAAVEPTVDSVDPW